MSVLSNATGGLYYNAPDAATLNQIYTTIAGNLVTAAGANTQMTLNFQNVTVSNVSVPGANALDYVPANPGSTDITWQDGVTNNTDQSSQWANTLTNPHPQLFFNVGTIFLGQSWQATFRLRAKLAGKYDLFNGSYLVFNNGSAVEQLPNASFFTIPNLTNTNGNMYAMTLSPISAIKNGDNVNLQWNTSFPDPDPSHTIDFERVYYTTSSLSADTCGNASWTSLTQQSNILSGETEESTTFGTPPPGTYWICVRADSQWANPSYAYAETSTSFSVGTTGKAFIKLE